MNLEKDIFAEKTQGKLSSSKIGYKDNNNFNHLPKDIHAYSSQTLEINSKIPMITPKNKPNLMIIQELDEKQKSIIINEGTCLSDSCI